MAAWILYVAGFEVTVRSGFAERLLNRRPHKLAVAFDSAHSWFPFWATATGIEARGQAPRLRWRAHVDQASGWLLPWRLASRRLQLARVRVAGVELALLREPQAEGEAARPAIDLEQAMPVILPLASPPPGPPALPRWTIEVADYVATGVREIWMERFRLSTDAQASGALTLLLPTREIEIAGTRIEFTAGSLTVADQTLGEGLAGSGDLSVSRFPYLEERGLEALGHVSGNVRVSGRVSGGRFWLASMPPQDWLQLDPDTAEIAGEIRLEEGELQPGTRFEFRQDDYDARAFEFHVKGDVLGTFEVSSGPAGAQAEGRVNFRDYAIQRSAAAQPDLIGTGLVVVATTRDLELEKLATMKAEARLELGQAHVPDLSRLSELMPPSAGLSLVGGSGRAGGGLDLELPAFAARGAVQVELDDVQVRYGDLDLLGRMRIDLALATAALPEGRFDLSGSSFSLTEFQSPQLAGEGTTAETPVEEAGWWARIELPEGEIHLPPDPAAAGRLHIRLRDSVPFIGLFETRRNLPGWVERLLTVRDLHADSGFAYRDAAFTLDEFTMPFKRASIRARVRFGPEHKTGILLVGWRKLHIGVRFDDERRRLKLLGVRDWYAAQELDLSTSAVTVDPDEIFSEEALGMVSFVGLGDQPVSLADAGSEVLDEAGGDESTAAAPAPFEIVPGSLVRGDLDADGQEEAAVLLVSRAAGASAGLFLAALDERSGRAENVATLPLGERPAIGRLRIDGDRIVLDPPVEAAPAVGPALEPIPPSSGGGAVPPAQPLDTAAVPIPAPLPESWRLAGRELVSAAPPADPAAAPAQ